MGGGVVEIKMKLKGTFHAFIQLRYLIENQTNTEFHLNFPIQISGYKFYKNTNIWPKYFTSQLNIFFLYFSIYYLKQYYSRKMKVGILISASVKHPGSQTLKL